MTPTRATSCKFPAGLHRKVAQHRNAVAFVILFIGAGAATSNLTGPFQSPQTAPILEWGAAISAFQAEGGVNKGGRGTSIWEPFAKKPFRILDGSNADVTSNFYEKYRGDVGIMKQLGLQNFRFSVAWPRIYPQGSGQVNHEGLAFYHDLLDALIEAGITPHVTLYHWDLPQALQDKYGGWTNTSAIVRDFVNYVGTVVESFGDKVQYYATINEPSTICAIGHGLGIYAPGLMGEYYRCVYSMLRAHAAAVKRIRAINPRAKTGLVMFHDWPEPYSNSQADREAAERYFDFQVGIYADPIFKGDYPESVKQRVPAWVLPPISPSLARDLQFSLDFYGLNHYSSLYVWYSPGAMSMYSQVVSDYIGSYIGLNGSIIGVPTGVVWAYAVPFGFRKILKYVQDRYSPNEIHCTEQGYGARLEDLLGRNVALRDFWRIWYLDSYLQAAKQAIHKDNVRLAKYFVWSFLDNWEWTDGFTVRFGIVYVDYKNNQTRYLKDSARWLAQYFGTGSVEYSITRSQGLRSSLASSSAGWRDPIPFA